ncbi:MAG TPA: type II CAAX endopeptidase family protein [Terriglobales bacterium]|nr:type II CAAX endopeptidase family protein [Terriglobales bacterium]
MGRTTGAAGAENERRRDFTSGWAEVKKPPEFVSEAPSTLDRPTTTATAVVAAALGYAMLIAAFWFTARRFGMPDRLGSDFVWVFLSFALLLLPYWAFGFGLADVLRRNLRSSITRILAPFILVLPYFSSLPIDSFRADLAAGLIAVPLGIAALFEFAPPGGKNRPQAGLSWQDALALIALGVPVQFRLLAAAWPYAGLSAMPKLLLVDAALYAFLVVRRLDGVGYDFRPRLRDLLIGLREWALFAPIAITLGLSLGFIAFQPHIPDPGMVAAAWLITFFFVAIPEELFFRGFLFNLIERRLGGRWGLLLSSAIFGLSHFNKPLPFNWRYVLLATIAGVFYGRAWRDRRRLLPASIAHATVDVVWGVWFQAGP